ncbi:hypothetical protein SAMN05421788_101632 [Filimonas lacunae]|uniref:Uncharacterized protein n=1 Tax=Filimonas lacunae TaxID=477680 RepID=A0A173MNZ4_9BACT|nr:hypothetical protein [Filimonas lacunae]BAV09189.1 hypothetical protein FLA_5237 [Filimonas lacunae]SIS68673.1 hypothetical protein SAMN05421788_101632 [Filimonas lacunae]
MQIGELNLVEALIELEVRVRTMERSLGFISENNPGIKTPTREQLKQISTIAREEVAQRYPSLGLTWE